MNKRSLLLLLSAALVPFALSCKRSHSSAPKKRACPCPGKQGIGAWTAWPKKAKKGASGKFWKHWGDGKAEMSGYVGVTPRYGSARKAKAVLIFVTEPMHRKTWVKDDQATGAQRINVLKLNFHLTFRTGIYPYSALTSVFAPVDHWRGKRFSPGKVSLSVQEWCGHVFTGLWPGNDRYLFEMRSYFAGEGDSKKVVKASSKGLLFEDALWIQFRELDGAFHTSNTWQGKVVPGLWWQRRRHRPLRPLAAKITRSQTKTQTRFVLEYTAYRWKRTIDVERRWPHRILGWSSTEGEKMKLRKSARLPYWSLNKNGDQRYLNKLF